MIFHLQARQIFRLASVSAVSIAFGLCAVGTGIEPKSLADEQNPATTLYPPTLSASGKIVDRLSAAADYPEDTNSVHSVPLLVNGFEFFLPTQDVSAGLQALASTKHGAPQLQLSTLAVADTPKNKLVQGKLAGAVTPPTRPKPPDGIQSEGIATAEATERSTHILGLNLPRFVSAVPKAIVRDVVAWSGRISQRIQDL